MEDGDSDGDIHSDGGTDRTGHDIVHGARAFLKGTNIKAGTGANWLRPSFILLFNRDVEVCRGVGLVLQGEVPPLAAEGLEAVT